MSNSPNQQAKLTRRRAVRAGSLAVPGLSLPSLLKADLSAGNHGPSFGRAKNIIFLYLAGGPPQHETFDPKPDAPEKIRGPFKPISTTIPGIQFCELLPRTAALADRMAVIRSMSTDDNIHSSSGAWVLTGYKYRGANARRISENDWPYFGSLVKMLRPGEKLPALSTVWLPDVMRLNENVTPAGQTAGFLGARWNPEVFVGDPSAASYEIESLRTTDIDSRQMRRRHQLLRQLEEQFGPDNQGLKTFDTFQQQAFDLLTSGKAREAFNVSEEPSAVRDRYGRNRWGQSVLLARRLVEAGVRLVHVHWPREPGDNAADNPLWDTHAQNADRVEDVLCPMFDVGYSALLLDLEERGLLDETLVVAIGEFGRTPKINAKGGRDHWGAVFSCALAGAGISGGQVFGSSDRDGAYPATNKVQPGALTATMFHLLGVNHQGSFPDFLGRPHRLTEGEPIWGLLGDEPATTARTESSGDITRVPAFDPSRHLMHTDFNGPNPILPTTVPSRPKGWRAEPFVASEEASEFAARLIRTGESKNHASLGVTQLKRAVVIRKDASAWLSQEVRSPFSGTYRCRVRLRAEASSQQLFDREFRENFRCRLSFFQFKSQQKKPNERTDLASKVIEPQFSKTDGWQSFELSKRFINTSPGGNFSFGAGLGVLIEVTKIDGSDSNLAAGEWMHIRIADVELTFVGKEVNDNVTV